MKRNLLKLAVFFGVLALAAQAQALLITPEDPIPIATGDQTSQDEINAYLALNYPELVEIYKHDVGEGESGPLAGSYETTFLDTPTDPSGALIEYTGGPIAEDAFLLVKDGNHSPAWYLFDLSGWNGTDDLELSGFWPDQGAISHVTLYGGTTTVPEPGTLLLLGSGLVGLALYGRKSFKR
jgi:hypothetical protein